MDTPDSKLVTPREIALLSADEAYKKLNSSQKGLTTAKAAERRAQFGLTSCRSCLLPHLEKIPPAVPRFIRRAALNRRRYFHLSLTSSAAATLFTESLHCHPLRCPAECLHRICPGLYGGTCHFHCCQKTGAA